MITTELISPNLKPQKVEHANRRAARVKIYVDKSCNNCCRIAENLYVGVLRPVCNKSRVLSHWLRNTKKSTIDI